MHAGKGGSGSSSLLGRTHMGGSVVQGMCRPWPAGAHFVQYNRRTTVVCPLWLSAESGVDDQCSAPAAAHSLLRYITVGCNVRCRGKACSFMWSTADAVLDSTIHGK